MPGGGRGLAAVKPLDDALLEAATRRTRGGRPGVTRAWPSAAGATRTTRPTVSVLIPALNEAENLPVVLPRIPLDVDEVVLVDGHSWDETQDIARGLLPDIRIVRQEGQGKGAALRSGIAACRGDIVIMLDADGSTDPAEIPLFVGALLAGADLVKGSRFMQGGGTADMPRYRKLGNGFFVRLVRLGFGSRYTDLCYGYIGFWRDVAGALHLDADGFEIETLINVRALKAHLRVVEVPSFEHERIHGEGKLKALPDGWRVLKTIVRELNPMRATVSSQREPDVVPERT